MGRSSVSVVVGGDGAGGCSSCWGLWSTGGYRPATHEIVPGIVAPTASDTHGQARDLGVLLSVLRRRLICGMLGRCEIRPSLVGSRIFRRSAIL